MSWNKMLNNLDHSEGKTTNFLKRRIFDGKFILSDFYQLIVEVWNSRVT